MRVLVVTNLYPHQESPCAGVFVHEQVQALRAAGVEVDVQFVNGTSSKLNYIKGIIEFWRRIRAKRYDLVHAHYVYAGWIARMQLGLPVIVTSHGSDTLGHEGWLLRRLYPLVDAMTITSKQNQERVRLMKTHLLPCGVDTELFKPQDQSEARRSLGWDPERKVMLYVGRDAPRKRLDIIRQAHEIISRQRSDVDLVLLSDVEHREIPTYMNAADVFVFASETEGAPVVIKEAMACNLPIVSVDVGDVAEILSGVNGCYMCERTPESLAGYAIRVLESGGRSETRARIVDMYSLDATAKRLVELYQQVMRDRR